MLVIVLVSVLSAAIVLLLVVRGSTDACAACGRLISARASHCRRCQLSVTALQDTLATTAASRPVWRAAGAGGREAAAFAAPVGTISRGPVPPAPSTRLVGPPDGLRRRENVPAQAGPPPLGHPGARHRTGRSAIGTVIAAITLGGVLQAAFYVIVTTDAVSPATANRYANAAILFFYALIFVLVVSAVRQRGVPLVWRRGSAVVGVAVGLLWGAGLALGMMELSKLATGHFAPSQQVVLQVGDAGIWQISAALLLAMVCAPIVEEILFRGLLMESLRRRWGHRAPLFLSAMAFMVWHFNPSGVFYFVAMGVFLGLRYRKRGLACSMATHAAFNGALTIVAILLVTGPAHLVNTPDLALQASGGWTQRTNDSYELVLDGPAGASVFVGTTESGRDTSPASVLADVKSGHFALPESFATFDFTLRPSSARIGQFPVGQVVRADVGWKSDNGELVVLPSHGKNYLIMLDSAGSARAQRDFTTMMTTLHIFG